jgi:ferredoxin-NADP reductase
MKIIKTSGKIIEIKKLTSTAMEITFSLEDEIDFLPGAFVNIFFNIEGEKNRRAYSISSDYKNKKEIKISVLKQEG